MINDRSNLVFSVRLCLESAVIDHRSTSSESRLEKFADFLLAESRYWLGQHSIHLYNDHIDLVVEKRRFMTTADKIISFVKGFLLFIPGVYLKSIAWLKNVFKVYQRCQLIRDQLNKPENFIIPNFDAQLHVIKARTFTKAMKQEQSILFTVPECIKFIILSYLKNKDRGRFALTCKEHYHLAAKFYIKGLHKHELYPFIIKNALQKSGRTQLPQGVLPKKLYYLVTKHAIEKYKDLLSKPTSVDNTRKFLIEQIYYQLTKMAAMNSLNSFIDTLKVPPIQTLQTSEGLGLMISLKNNSSYRPNLRIGQQILIIIKLQSEWMAFWSTVSPSMSSAMYLFMNDIRFYDNAPQLEDYFERLFKGEPCGDFQVNTNNNIQIDYKLSRASDVLQEGPRVLADGVTPIVQLWSA